MAETLAQTLTVTAATPAHTNLSTGVHARRRSDERKLDGASYCSRDENKRLSNLADHGVDRSAIVFEDRRKNYGEARFTAVPKLGARLHVIVFVKRNGDRRESILPFLSFAPVETRGAATFLEAGITEGVLRGAFSAFGRDQRAGPDGKVTAFARPR